MAGARDQVAPLYGGFFLLGVVTVFLGPAIPELRETWSVDASRIATLFLAQFAASSAGAIVSTLHKQLSLVAGYGLMCAGLAGLAWSAQRADGWTLAWTSTALVGLGIGLVTPAANLTVAHLNPRRRGAALAVLNLLWGAGAVSCQLLFAALRGRASATLALVPLAASAGLVALCLVRRRRELAAAKPPQDGARRRPDPGPPAPFLLHLTIAAMMFLYVGTETSIGGWLVSLSDELAGRHAVSVLVNACFWGALLIGRAGAPALLDRMTEPRLFQLSLVVAGAGSLVLLLAPSRLTAAAGAFLAGLGLASLFPLTVSILAACTASTDSRSTGWIFAFTGLGGAFLPWWTGQVAAAAGLRAGFVVPAASLALLAGLFLLQSPRLRPGRLAEPESSGQKES